MEAAPRGRVEQMSHYPAFCAACRTMVLIDYKASAEHIRPWRWAADGTAEGVMFCSDECEHKGAAKPARDRAPVAHIRLERSIKPEQRRGFEDAIAGFDCIGTNPSYVKGHGEGMKARDLIEEMVNDLEKHGLEGGGGG